MPWDQGGLVGGWALNAVKQPLTKIFLNAKNFQPTTPPCKGINMSKLIGRNFGSYTITAIHHTEKTPIPSGFAYIPWVEVTCVCGKKFVRRVQSLSPTKKCPHQPSLKSLPNEQRLRGMHDSCTNPNNRAYKYYGAKGIKVCDRWSLTVEGLQNFNADMGEPPTPKHSIDRIDVYDDYAPHNCRWATPTEQAQNKWMKVPIPRLCTKPLERHERENDTALLDEIHKLLGVEK